MEPDRLYTSPNRREGKKTRREFSVGKCTRCAPEKRIEVLKFPKKPIR